jgi:hypothetical protein
MINDLIDALADIIKERFSVLDQAYIDDLLAEVRKDAEDELTTRFTIRYVLFDGATEQLESRILFSEEKKADEAALEGFYGKSCRVAAVLLEK